MKTLLVLTPTAEFADAIGKMVDPRRFRALHCSRQAEAEMILSRGCVDACLVETDVASAEAVQALSDLRRRFAQGPLIVVAGTRQWEREEEAYLQGASLVLSKPLRAGLLNQLLDRALQEPVSPAASVPSPAGPAAALELAGAPGLSSAETLNVLRRFSPILAHSLHADTLVREFVLLLRELLHVNRVAVYLRPRSGPLGDPVSSEGLRRLRVSFVAGLPAELLRQFDLSLDAGIGKYVSQNGRILRRGSNEGKRDQEVRREFEMVRAQVAVPIFDRENLLGVALFDNRLTDEMFTAAELGLIFHLFEELGVALKMIWLHEQAVAGHEMMEDILRQLHSACLVVSWDLRVLQANDAARLCFGRPDRGTQPLEFAHLPEAVGSKVFEVLKTGQPVRHYKFSLPAPGNRSFRLTVTPFQEPGMALPTATLVFAQDCTDEDQLRALEIEAANLRLVKIMAERLSHEVGNALVPLSTHQQLLSEQKTNPLFLQSLQVALDEGVRRVSRLASQMQFLSRDLPSRAEPVPLEPLVQEAFRDAQRHQPAGGVALAFDQGRQPLVLQGDRAGLKHALYEVLLNALQAGPDQARVQVRAAAHADGTGQRWADVEITDSGPGFSPQVAERATDPFFTTRHVGLGLGLTVARKIIESHRGRLEIVASAQARGGVVRICLPLPAQAGQPPGI